MTERKTKPERAIKRFAVSATIRVDATTSERALAEVHEHLRKMGISWDTWEVEEIDPEFE